MIATSTVGVRELKNNLSRYLDSVRAGLEIVVTDRGHPIARLLPAAPGADHLAGLIAGGIVRAPRSAARRRPERRIVARGPVSELVAGQRR